MRKIYTTCTLLLLSDCSKTPHDNSTSTETFTSEHSSSAPTSDPVPCTASTDLDQTTTWVPGDPEPETTGEMDQLCPEHTNTDDCCCFSSTGYFLVNVCPAKSVCPVLYAKCLALDLEGCDEKSLIVEECNPAVDCALAALQKGDAATIHIVIDLASNTTLDRDLFLTGEGTAISADSLNGEDVDVKGPVVNRLLNSKDHFAQCEKISSEAGRFECILRAQTGPGIEECIELFEPPMPF